MRRYEQTPLNNIVYSIRNFSCWQEENLFGADFFLGASQNANLLIRVSVAKSLSGSDFSRSEKNFFLLRGRKKRRGKRGKEEKNKGEDS